MVIYYRLMGSATTDDNGVASYTYTGHGSGEMDFIASTSNPIDNSSLVSETYELIDATFLDRATQSDHNDNYFYSANYTRDFTREANNTSVVLKDTNGGAVTHSVGDGMCFEMDVDEIENYCQVNVVRTETGKSASYHGHKYLSACKIRVEVLPTQTIFKQIINGVETTVQTINNSTNNTMRVYFPRTDNTDAKFKFRNFMIYPI